MNIRALVVGLTLACTQVAHAGHGLMKAFGEVEWLSDPGRTPDQIGYAFDLWGERARLAVASNPAERYMLGLQFAREKLAEIDAAIKQNRAPSADVAIVAYRKYIGIAADVVATEGAIRSSELAQKFAIALLEHQYIISVNYLDLPRESRPIIAQVIEAAVAEYERNSPRLNEAFKATLFFKEEEVRWSWEVAQQADRQGL